MASSNSQPTGVCDIHIHEGDTFASNSSGSSRLPRVIYLASPPMLCISSLEEFVGSNIDECLSMADCHANATCINTDGNFTCECNEGFDDQNITYPGRNCEDVTLPNITGCPDSQSVSTLPGLPYAIVSWIEPNASDSSGYVSLVFNGPRGNGFEYPIGEYNVSYTATDWAGNAATCQFVINVIDSESPNITCPDDITMQQMPYSAFLNVTWSAPVVVDNSGIYSEPQSTPESGSLFGIGNTTVNVTSQDPSGNVGGCQFTITVLDIDECISFSDCHANATCTNTYGNFTCECNEGFDDQNIAYPGRSCEDVTLPNITGCPDSQSVSTLPGLPYAIVSWIEPSASDSSGYVSLVFNGPRGNGFRFDIGEYNISYTATDWAGNAVTCQFEINVIDRESPNITCPDDITVQQMPNSAFLNVTWSDPVVVDNSGFYSEPQSIPESGTLFPVDNTTVNVTSQDLSGNVGSCQFIIFVLDINECISLADCHANATCINTYGNFTCECNEGFDDLNIAYPGRDCEDVTLPNITGCPDSQSVSTLPGLPYAIVSWIEPSASDSSGYVSLVFNGPRGNGFRFDIGEYNISYTATDWAGNAVTCQFEINVIDRESPNITCPDDITMQQMPNSAFLNVTWSDPVVVDNSGFYSEPQSIPESGTLFPVDNTTVNITSQDLSGNVGSCQFIVLVLGHKYL
ncbi:hyalin-like [Diadema antillarum]|uniref:hyalin-like n=1 Tax=Diadema antillarum TaxID=105358 RepID=UPI003A83E622